MSRLEKLVETVEGVFAPIAEMKAAKEEEPVVPQFANQRGDANIKFLGVLTVVTGTAIAASSALAGEVVDAVPDDWQALGVGSGAGAVAVGSIIYLCGRK